MPQRKDSITLKDKAIIIGIIIILSVVIAILINQNYYNSQRDNLMSADFLMAFATPDFDYDEAFQDHIVTNDMTEKYFSYQ